MKITRKTLLPRALGWFGLWFWALACAQTPPPTAEAHWLVTWGCGPQLTERANLPPGPLANNTLRQFVHVTAPGKSLRLRFSNAYGTEPVTLRSVHIALAAGAGSVGAGEIDPGTDRSVDFHGRPSAVIPPGQELVSDPIPADLPALTNLAVSVYFGDTSATTITGHPGSRTTSFIQPGNAVSVPSMPAAAKTAHWYLLTGVEALSPSDAKAIVVLGDSITDGRGSTTDGNDRWPDVLAARVRTNAPTAAVSVVNMGIGGNGIFGGLGPAAVKRFDRDVLNQSGARWVIVFEGVNDIGGARSDTTSLATNLIKAYTQFAEKAHAHNLRAYGATITPFGGNRYYTPPHETIRQTVNAWIRTNTVFDGVIDFDAVVRDPVTRTNLLSQFDTGDGLHLNPTGYRAMADSINLNLFTR